MRTAASIFSWLGGIITTIIAFVNVGQGVKTAVTYLYFNGYDYSYQMVIVRQPSPGWLWFLVILFTIVRLIILIWRQNAVANGKKVGCGVCTLLLASVIGGILTLCIPEDQLG